MNTGLYCVYNPACVTGGGTGCVEQTGCQHQQPQTKCFFTALRADSVAAPDIQTSGAGTAFIEVAAHTVTLSKIDWNIPNVSAANPIIGLHIHEGDHSQNGGILVGFCGSSPLPTFSGVCPDHESPTGSGGGVVGQGCTLGDSAQGGPCVQASGSDAASDPSSVILASSTPRKDFYLNLHTLNSYDTNAAAGFGPIGLIRGQLVQVGCSAKDSHQYSSE